MITSELLNQSTALIVSQLTSLSFEERVTYLQKMGQIVENLLDAQKVITYGGAK